MLQSQNPPIPFNKVQGIASTNVHAYSNGHDDFFSVERHYLHGIFMGFKWQCVEFARQRATHCFHDIMNRILQENHANILIKARLIFIV